MPKLLTWVTAGLLAVVAVRADAALLITEVVYDEVGTDTIGEWIEIFNNGSTSIDLSMYKIGDEENASSTSSTEATHQFPAGSLIAPGEVQIIALNADRFNTLHGFLPNYEISGANVTVPNMTSYTGWDADGGVLTLGNSGDQVLLLDPADNIIDGLSWIGGAFYIDQSLPATQVNVGQSYERVNGNVDHDLAADWRLGNLHSAGSVAVPEPVTCALGLVAAGVVALSRRQSL